MHTASANELFELLDVIVCMPLVLITNFSLFQYLTATFWKRRHEPRVRLLLFIAALSFVCLIPFAFPDRQLMRDLNDVSEVCSVLTFLLQITILTRDVGKRIKIRSLWLLMWVGESLVVLSLTMLVANVIDLFTDDIDMAIVEIIDTVVTNVSLVFVVLFRFYFLAIAKGFRKVWATQKTEIACYFLFLSHEYPFHVLNVYTDLTWDHVQGLWMRLTIVACLWMTVRARLSSQTSKQAITTTQGPKNSQFDHPRSMKLKPVNKVGVAKTALPGKSLAHTATSTTYRSRQSLFALLPSKT